jgi:hypothetical protein
VLGSQPDVNRQGSEPTTQQLPRWVPEPVTNLIAQVDRWRQRLPDPMNRVPALAFLAGAVGLAIGGFLIGVFVVLLLRSGRPELTLPVPSASSSVAPKVAPVVDRASADERQAAEAAGAPGLKKLADKYPKDVTILIPLAQAQRDAKDHVAAAATVDRALKLDPGLSRNAHVAAVLWVTAQNEDAREATFLLLEGPMGSKGAEIAYDLIVTPKVSAAVRKRSERFVGSAQFEKAASPALRVAVKLRDARKCDDIHALLDDAIEHSDDRSLPYLRRFQNTKSCKVRRRRVDCWPCLRADRKLIDAIEAAASRKGDQGGE